MDQVRRWWFSAKQLEVMKRLHAIDPEDDYRETFVNVNGSPVQFTESSLTDQPSGKWDDYKLVHSEIAESRS